MKHLKKGYLGLPKVINLDPKKYENKPYEERLQYLIAEYKDSRSVDSILESIEEFSQMCEKFDSAKAVELKELVKKYTNLGREDKTIADES